METQPRAHVLSYLGDWISSVKNEEIPSAGIENSKRAILDFCGVALAGGVEPDAQVLRDYAASQGAEEALTAIGVGGVQNAETASFVGGAMGHLLDFDDANDIIAGHPTAPMFPAVLAMAEEVEASGADIVAAYAVGFEVQAHLGRMLHFAHYEKGWHPTATLGVFGSAAATARLLALGPSETTSSLAIAASSAAGLKASFGTLAKPIQVGRAAQAGLVAARVAGFGASARPDAFEHVQGFAEVYNGPSTYRLLDREQFGDGLWEVARNGVHIKLYPCGGATHSAIDSALAVRHQLDRDLAGAKKIVVMIHPRRLKHTNRPNVSTPLEAKFSVQYGVAIALLFGGVRLEHYTPEVVNSPEVAAVLEKVQVQSLPDRLQGPEHFAAEVHVEFDGGVTFRERYERPRGRSEHDTLTREEVGAKFEGCAGFSLREDEVATLEDLLWNLDRLERLDELGQLLRVSTATTMRLDGRNESPTETGAKDTR